MKNKKGFTLTEILATIVILGVILAIAVPSYNALSKKFEKEYYDKLEKTVLAAAKTYWKDNSDKRPNDYLESDNVNLSTLINGKYIDSIKEYKDKSEVPLSESYYDGVVVTVKVADGYDYKVCLNGFNNDSDYCNEAWKNNENISKCDTNKCDINPNFYLYYDENYQNTKENQEKLKAALAITPAYTKTDQNGAELKRISINGQKVYPKNITSITKKELGTKKVTYEESDITSTVEVFQYPTPDIKQNGSMVTLSLNDDVKALFGRKLADKSEEETKFSHYQVSTDGGKSWEDVQSTKNFSPGKYDILYRVVDNLNNTGEIGQEQIEIEETQEPELSVTAVLEDGSSYNGQWTNKNVTFNISAILQGKKLKYKIDNGNEKGLSLDTNNNTSVKTNVESEGVSTSQYTFLIEGTNKKEIRAIKIDKKEPTITAKLYNGNNLYTENWTNSDLQLVVTVKDNDSGINDVKYKSAILNKAFEGYDGDDYTRVYTTTLDTSMDSVEITATDNAGNTETLTVIAKIDKSSPYCWITRNKDEGTFKIIPVDGLINESGIASITINPTANEKKCGSIIKHSCNQYIYAKGKTYTATVTDKAGNKGTCSITIENSNETPKEEKLSSPIITLSSQKQTSSNVTFSLTNPNSKGTLYYSFDNKSWTKYAGGNVELISWTGSRKVYAKVKDNNKNSEISNATGYCNKDGVSVSPILKSEYFQLKFILPNDPNGVTKGKYEYIYWGAEKTNDNENKESSKIDKCNLASVIAKRQVTTNSTTINLYQKYPKQYYCFAVRPYREKEINEINRWTIQRKHVKTTTAINASKYNGVN